MLYEFTPIIKCSYACILSHFSRFWLFSTPWTVTMGSSIHGISRQEHWSGLPFPLPGDLPNSGIKPTSLMSSALAGGFFTTSASCEALNVLISQFSSVAQSCPTLCDPMDHSMIGLPVHWQLLEFTQTHVHWVSDAIQPFHPLASPLPPTLNLSQHRGLSQWVSSSHQMAKGLEFQLQHQSFQWIFRTDFL